MFNKYGEFGSKYSEFSPFNPYGSPPMIVVDHQVVGYVSINGGPHNVHPHRLREIAGGDAPED